MEKRTVFYRPPKGSPYVMRVRVLNTRYIQKPRTGLFDGRRRIKKGERGDKITRFRVKKPFTLVHTYKTKKGATIKRKKHYSSGEFFTRP
jgi:hypothetical protein